MKPSARRALVRHAIALDLIVVACGVGLLLSAEPLGILATFLAAVVISAWLGQEEAGLLATAYSTIALALFFGDTVDVDLLTAFAVIGAIVSTLVRLVRRIPAEAADVVTPAAPSMSFPAALPFTIGLPLLMVVIYTNVSDTVMRLYHVPSPVQPMIALLLIVVWQQRRQLRPGDVMLSSVPFFFALFAFVTFTTTIWAQDLGRADSRVSEALKAVIICILVASLAASWRALHRGIVALIAAAAALSAASVIQVTTGRLADAFGGMVHLKTGQIYGETVMPRASGPPVHDPNSYARILLITIPFAIALGFAEEKRPRRLAYFGAAVLIAAATFVTYSRGAMFSVLVMGLVFAVAARVSVKRLAAGAAVALVLLAILPANVTRRFTTIESVTGDAAEDSSIQIRKLWGRAALEMFDEHPVTGVGAAQFSTRFEHYANIVGSTAVDYEPAGTARFPHSLFLEIGSETGLMGMAPFLAAVAAAFLALYDARRTLMRRGDGANAAVATAMMLALTGYLVASVFLHEPNLRYIGMLFGLTLAVQRLSRAAAPRPAMAL